MGKLVCDHVSGAEKQRIAERFIASSSDCCFEPGFTRHVRSRVSSVDELMGSSGIQQLIFHTFSATPVSNVPIEDRFARQHAQKFACHGRAPHFSTTASKHVISEFQTWHHIAMEELEIKRQLKLAAQPPTLKQDGVFQSAWHAYVAAGSGGLQAISASWQRLSFEQREPYLLAAARSREPRAPVAPLAPSEAELAEEETAATPFGIGCREFPLRQEMADAVCERVTAAHDEWSNMVGGMLLVEATLPVCETDVSQCCDKFGMGVCSHTFDGVAMQLLVRHKRTTWALARVGRQLPLDPELLFPTLLLFCLRYPAVDGAPVVERIYLLAFALFNPVVQAIRERFSDSPTEPVFQFAFRKPSFHR